MAHRWGRLACVSVVGTLIPTVAHADLVWPALYLEPRLLSVPVIGLGLLLEAGMLRFGFQMSWPKALFASTVVNAISAAVGIVVIPLAGIIWEVFPGLLLYFVLKIGTFSPLTWAGNFLVATGVTTSIEVVCLKTIFKLPLNQRTWGLWLIANAATVGLTFASFIIRPIDYQNNVYYIWLIR